MADALKRLLIVFTLAFHRTNTTATESEAESISPADAELRADIVDLMAIPTHPTKNDHLASSSTA